MTAYSIPVRRAAERKLPLWLDYGLVWVPGSRKPGLLGFGLFLMRSAVVPFALSFALLAPFAGALPRHPLLGLTVMLSLAVLVEECGRYGFARRADDPARAVALFSVLVIAVETATFWRPSASVAMNLALRAPSMVVHLLASTALLVGLRRRRRLLPILAAIYIAHVLFDVGPVALFGGAMAQAAGAPAAPGRPAS